MTASATLNRNERRATSPWWWAALIFGATLLVYFPALRAEFVWNDADYVTSPELRSAAGLARIWFDVGATEQYYPLLHSAFWLEHRLWGNAAAGYHLATILFHAGSAFLLGLVLSRLKVRGAWLAAMLFALHPVCVESVAWIAEQKNTLSLLFYLVAAYFYLGFVETRSARSYALASGLFVCALLSKSLTATLPAALLVVLWWRQGALNWRRDVAPLLPWLVVGGAFGMFTGWVERVYVGVGEVDLDLSGVQRALVAGRIICFYLGKLVWPVDLMFIYPRWQIDASNVGQYLFPLVAVGLMVTLWCFRNRSRGRLTAALFFVGSLFPLLGFLDVYGFVFSFVADHWQYLPSIGIFALAGAGLARLVEEGPRGRRWASRIAVAALLGGLGVMTWKLSLPYRNLVSFYQNIIDRNPEAWMPHNNLGVELMNAGHPMEAIAHYREALRLRPHYFDARNNLGLALDSIGKMQEAAVHFQSAVTLRPTYARAHANYGNTLFGLGRLAEAEREYRATIALEPDLAQAHYNLAVVLAGTHRVPEAITHYERALQRNPDYADAHFNLGSALFEIGRLPEAVAHFERALSLAPSAEIHNNLGNALMALGQLTEAATHFSEALKFDPKLAAAHLNLAVVFRRMGRMDEARQHEEQARRLTIVQPFRNE